MRKFARSVKFALQGIKELGANDRNFRIMLAIAFMAVILSFYFPLSTTERAIVFMLVFLVLAFEALNSMIERLLDFLHPHQEKRVGHIKDIAAGAVFLISLCALIAGLIIFSPHILSLALKL